MLASQHSLLAGNAVGLAFFVLSAYTACNPANLFGGQLCLVVGSAIRVVKTLCQIEADVATLAKLIGASANDLPTYDVTRDFGYTHIEVRGNRYDYVTVERGQELSRQSTASYDELLYWVFRDATHNMAFAYELANRVEDQDCRRIAFPKQVELLNRVSPAMGTRLANEVTDILTKFPYDDEPTKAVNRLRHGEAT
jgi:hypothetical protein